TMVPRLLEHPLAEVASAADIQTAYAPLRAAHEGFIELVRQRAEILGRVVFVDLGDQTIDAAGKFVTYALYPTSAYSVVLTRSKSKCKISIGYNPWSNVERTHNIAAICERHGGGGHPVVGAISVAADALERAREIARDVARELGTG
ncbi:MAG: Exopolyphosphatase-related protein, partial [Myxococcaceae bacterium]|nr:Exopolyphosphatase-related protein [Myxococcaceae bacterium]